MQIVPILLLAATILSPATRKFDGPRPGIDVTRYDFRLNLSDHSNVIDGLADVTVRFTEGPRDFYLDLVSMKPGDVGMMVSSVSVGDLPLRFEHDNDRLWIRLDDDVRDSVATFRIAYRGVPADGLIISQNRYGDRTFFADNWPNRARHWLPTIDHPMDKALVDFIVTAPAHYQVVANGELLEETDVQPGIRLTHWSSTRALPSKIMAIGIARFAVQNLGSVDGVPLQTWVYPQAREAGFYDFAVAEPALHYFIEVLGEFPYAKLANVQSTTRWGGMENASAIFYDEKSVNGSRRQEAWVAHEIAHQWFGDSATEVDWDDVWLSEGFATYFAHLYFEHYYGTERLAERMQIDRQAIVGYAKANPTSCVVDTTIVNPNEVLNINTYEKGGWTLHMLRGLVGDDTFWAIIRTYYDTYRFGNASTADFIRVAESVSGRDLGWFFDQWIHRPGVPELVISPSYHAESGQLVIHVRQKQSLPYRFTLEFELDAGSGREFRTVEISERESSFPVAVPTEPTAIRFDPNVRLLAQIEVR